MPSFSIDELATPTAVDGDGWADFERSIEVCNAVEEITYGTADLSFTAAEELPYYRNTFQPRRTLVARVDGEIVGRGSYETQTGESADTGWVSVQVLEKFRGRGIGRALADQIESIVAADGKVKAIAYIGIQDVDGPRIESPTGFGSVPLANRDVKFLTARGYSFEQVERLSRLPLPVVGITQRVIAATAASGSDYRVVTWHGRTPERWRADIAILGTRMSTDAPSAGLEEPEDVWTVERVLEGDERAEASGVDRLVAAIEHVPTGSLAGYTMLAVPPNPTRAVSQYATLVLREHRGHRLGMLLKAANLEYLEQLHPGRPSVTTFNAEENRFMLDINEAVGFVEIGFEAAWRKDL